ncbi:MAG: alpha/beta hydrolase [Gemmatimonadetes bacterium]|nr:alpha/beta hydrolase [Gemmatimonadota bacterium]
MADLTPAQALATYAVTRDVAYGTDPEQTMDVYVPREASRPRRPKYTVVFLHGGGYYISDKTKEERYIRPYLQRGVTVVNLNYRLKRGIPVATEDLTLALNFLAKQQASYPMNLKRVVLSGFSAGGHISSLVAVTANDPTYAHPLAPGIGIAGVVNFSGPVGGLDVVEKVFMDHSVPIMKEIGMALFTETEGYAPEEVTCKYEPLTYWTRRTRRSSSGRGGRMTRCRPSRSPRSWRCSSETRERTSCCSYRRGATAPRRASSTRRTRGSSSFSIGTRTARAWRPQSMTANIRVAMPSTRASCGGLGEKRRSAIAPSPDG